MLALESSRAWRAAAAAMLVSGCVTSAEVGGKPNDDAGTTVGETELGSTGRTETTSETEPPTDSNTDTESDTESDTDTTTGPDPMGYENVVEPGPDLAEARFRHASVLLDDGTVLVAGGVAGDDGIDSIEIFRPEHNDVVPGGTLLAGRFDPCALRLPDGRVLVLGGYLATTDIWDPLTQQTEPGPQLNADVGEPMCSITDDGTVVVADSFVAGKGYLVETWTPGDASFQELPSNTEMSWGGGHDGALFGDGSRMLLVGGYIAFDGEDPPPPGSNLAQIYDLNAQVYRSLEGWDDQGVILVQPGGDALVYRTNNEGLRAARLDTQSETFTDISPVGPYNLHPIATTRTDGLAVMGGGFELDDEGDLIHTDRVLLWDPAGVEIGLVGTLGEARSHGTATRLADGKIAIIGGYAGDAGSTKIDIYR